MKGYTDPYDSNEGQYQSSLKEFYAKNKDQGL